MIKIKSFNRTRIHGIDIDREFREKSEAWPRDVKVINC